MNITNFDRFRVASESDIASYVFMDVKKIGGSSYEGFMAVVNEIPSLKRDYFAKRKIEFRKKGREVTLIVYQHGNTEIDDHWKDAEILYSWEG